MRTCLKPQRVYQKTRWGDKKTQTRSTAFTLRFSTSTHAAYASEFALGAFSDTLSKVVLPDTFPSTEADLFALEIHPCRH